MVKKLPLEGQGSGRYTPFLPNSPIQVIGSTGLGVVVPLKPSNQEYEKQKDSYYD
jgi:hypothetical protein